MTDENKEKEFFSYLQKQFPKNDYIKLLRLDSGVHVSGKVILETKNLSVDSSNSIFIVLHKMENHLIILSLIILLLLYA